MQDRGIVAYRDKLDQVIDRYGDFLGDEAANLAREHGIPAAKELQANLTAIEGENRLLKIGIVGRVKSGKSSLLNALLFEGESILPKAATPMTAALTTLSYGESLAAEVEFFIQEDLRHIQDQYSEYKTREDRLYKDFLAEEQAKEARSRRSPEERASSRAKRAMKDGNDALVAAYEQYDKIEKSGLNLSALEEKTVLKFAELADLRRQLDDYVGATGRYMPVTKSVNIRLPQENLRDIEIVDTPGINDPVQSREARTRQHLSQCDVVLIVSPAGQFMSSVDLNLMDRITGKESIRELYVVASQADTQLYGNLKDESNGDLDRVLDRLTTDVLGRHLEMIIEDLKKRNPEVGNTYDQLLQQGKIIHSAGICESLKQSFDQKNAWDEGMQHVWDNLLVEYRNYFSAEDAELSRINLEKLSNISRIRDIIAGVREQKDTIIKDRQTEYIGAKFQSLRELKNGLLKYANDRHTQIESMEIEGFKKRRDSLLQSLEKTASLIREAHEESVKQVKKDLKDEFKKELESRDRQIQEGIAEEKGQESESFQTGVIFKKDKIRHIETIRTNAVAGILTESAEKMVEEIAEKTEAQKDQWRSELNRELTKILRQELGNEDVEAWRVREIIKNAVNSISISPFKYNIQLPKKLTPRGVLKDEEATSFFNEACDYSKNSCRDLRKKVNVYIDDLTTEMGRVRLDDRLLEKFNKELASLEESIEKKGMELGRIAHIREELKGIDNG